MNTQEKLALLKQKAAQRKMLTQWIDEAVLALRSPDMDGFCEASWQEVADALGVTRQAAWRMYRAVDTPEGQVRAARLAQDGAEPRR